MSETVRVASVTTFVFSTEQGPCFSVRANGPRGEILKTVEITAGMDVRTRVRLEEEMKALYAAMSAGKSLLYTAPEPLAAVPERRVREEVRPAAFMQPVLHPA